MVEYIEKINRVDGKIFIENELVATVSVYYGQSQNENLTFALSTVNNDLLLSNYNEFSGYLREFIERCNIKQAEFLKTVHNA